MLKIFFKKICKQYLTAVGLTLKAYLFHLFVSSKSLPQVPQHDSDLFEKNSRVCAAAEAETLAEQSPAKNLKVASSCC